MVAEIIAVSLYLLGIALASDHYPKAMVVREGETLNRRTLFMCILLWPAVEIYNLKGE